MSGYEPSLPATVIFTDGNMLRADHGMYLHGFTPAGDHFSVQIRQSNIPDLEHAGRLFVNDSLVPLRSPLEEELLQLLARASFAETPPDNAKDVVQYVPGPILTIDGLQSIRDAIEDYVRSDKYVDVATNGVPAIGVPWKPWQAVANDADAEASQTQHDRSPRRRRKQPERRTLALWLSAVAAVVVAAFVMHGMHRLQDLSRQVSRGMPRDQVVNLFGEPYLTLSGANGSGELLVWTDIFWQVDVKLDGESRVLWCRCVPANSWLRNAQSKLSSPAP